MSWPTSIREINNLPDEEKRSIYAKLLPEWLFSKYGIAPFHPGSSHNTIRLRCPPNSRALELVVKRDMTDLDAMLYLNMADTFNNQLLVLLVVVNDLDSPRFNIDVDEHGNSTHLGTTGRNLQAEEVAMKAGMAPGQIRKGLRVFKQTVPLFEDFVRNMGHDLFLIEPLAYHNAIIFERYGFSYMRGYQEMVRINREFQPGGELHQRLTEDRVFRRPDAWKSIRGRSWAIHDGILGHPFTGFQMYKRIGHHATIDTFPNAEW